MTHPPSHDYDETQRRLKVRVIADRAEIVRLRPPLPESIGSDISPWIVMWAMAAVVGICLLSTGLITAWARMAPRVVAVSNDGGWRVP
jgi:hypothetical protein